MKALMTVPITVPGGGIRFAYLDVDLPFAPHIDMDVLHVAWKDGRKVKGVALQFDEDNEPSLNVSLEPERARDAEDQESLLDQYEGHGWTAKAGNMSAAK